jgi:hypothetical protein
LLTDLILVFLKVFSASRERMLSLSTLYFTLGCLWEREILPSLEIREWLKLTLEITLA